MMFEQYIQSSLNQHLINYIQLIMNQIPLQPNCSIPYFNDEILITSQEQFDQAISQKQFCENSFILIEDAKKKDSTLYVPCYARCHFRNMTEMDIQNLSSRFVASMNIDFYLGKSKSDSCPAIVMSLHNQLVKNLKITFQNDFVLSLNDDVSNNSSEGDKLVRVEMRPYTTQGYTRYYTSVLVSTEFKFGLHSDIFFFPLQSNKLDMVMCFNPFKSKIMGQKVTIRFNCMDLQMQQKDNPGDRQPNSVLYEHLKQLHQEQNGGQQLTDQILKNQYIDNTNNNFFRNIRVSFPKRPDATDFGYYSVIQQDIDIQYTNDKQLVTQPSCYQALKKCLFCKKTPIDYTETQYHHQQEQRKKLLEDQPLKRQGEVAMARHVRMPKERQLDEVKDQLKEKSFCSAILKIPLLKASLGTIIQLCIPIFFLSFLTLVEFLYSASSSTDQVRGLKIGASSLIVATYISFIYSMRTVIPPTPSWSIFEVAVLILAASSIMPIIQTLYAPSYTTTEDPFEVKNGLFIAAFIINTILCGLIVILLVIIQIYMAKKLRRTPMKRVKMNGLIRQLTKKYFYVWRNTACRQFMVQQIKKELKAGKSVRFQKWIFEWR